MHILTTVTLIGRFSWCVFTAASTSAVKLTCTELSGSKKSVWPYGINGLKAVAGLEVVASASVEGIVINSLLVVVAVVIVVVVVAAAAAAVVVVIVRHVYFSGHCGIIMHTSNRTVMMVMMRQIMVIIFHVANELLFLSKRT